MKSLVIILLSLTLLIEVEGQLRRPPGNPPLQNIPEVEVMLPPISFLSYEVFVSYEGEEKAKTSRFLIIGAKAPVNAWGDRIRSEEVRRFALRFTRNIILVDSKKTFETIASGQSEYTWIWLEANASPPVENFLADPLYCRGRAEITILVFDQNDQKLKFLIGFNYFGAGRGLMEQIRKDFFSQNPANEAFYFFSLRWIYRRLSDKIQTIIP